MCIATKLHSVNNVISGSAELQECAWGLILLIATKVGSLTKTVQYNQAVHNTVTTAELTL